MRTRKLPKKLTLIQHMRAVVVILLLLYITNTLAYLYPSTVSILLLVILVGVLAPEVTTNFYRHKQNAALELLDMESS